VHINNLKSDLEKTTIRDTVEASFPVAYVDFKNNSIQGYIRCHSAKEAKQLLSDQNQFKEKLGESIIFRILEGQEEKIYWDLKFDLVGILTTT